MNVNPWVTIWLQPRATIRDAINSAKTPLALMIFLIVVTGCIETVTNFMSEGDRPLSLVMLIVVIILSSLISLGGWFIIAGLIGMIGRGLGGNGSNEDIRIAVALAMIPTFVSAIFTLLALITYKIGQVELEMMLAFVGMFFSIWAIFTYIKSIAEAHRFSAWLSLATLLLMLLILSLIFIVIYFIFGAAIVALFG